MAELKVITDKRVLNQLTNKIGGGGFGGRFLSFFGTVSIGRQAVYTYVLHTDAFGGHFRGLFGTVFCQMN